MRGHQLLKKIIWLEIFGGVLVLMFLWLDEFLDLPHHLFGAPATPANYRESLFETVLLLVPGTIIVGCSLWLARRLRNTMQSMDNLFSLVSHDLRSPFTNLLGNAELLRTSMTDLSREDQFNLIDGLYHAALKAYTSLDNLLQWAQLQYRDTPSLPAVINAKDLVQSVVDDLNDFARNKRLKLCNDTAPDMHVFADETELRSILRNLLSNAIKFSFPEGSIQVTTQLRGQKVYFQVSDQGPGISPRKRKHLLRRELALSTRGTAGEKGCGVGLFLVKEFVRRNGGKLDIRSTPGKGSHFIFSIPAAI